jgi:hypothetical protein
MAFQISFHLTMVTKEAFQTVVFPTEKRTTEKFQGVCHLNNTPVSNVISYKIYEGSSKRFNTFFKTLFIKNLKNRLHQFSR